MDSPPDDALSRAEKKVGERIYVAGNTSTTRSIATWLIALAALTLSPAAHAQKMTDVTVYVVKNLLSSPHFVALENGYWAEQGLNVQIKLTSGGRNVVQALQAGDAQIGHVAISGTLSVARAGGDKLIAVMPYYNAPDYMGKASAYSIVGRRDRGIDPANPASLLGKKIGAASIRLWLV